MGAWGIGHFENDDAGDWVWELEDAGSLVPVESAIVGVGPEDCLEAPDACMALAAGETIAAAVGRSASDIPETVSKFVSGLDAPVAPDLVAKARAAVERVLANSELRELWEETDEFDAWQSKVRDLTQRLTLTA